jgi:hypothetical protein
MRSAAASRRSQHADTRQHGRAVAHAIRFDVSCGFAAADAV